MENNLYIEDEEKIISYEEMLTTCYEKIENDFIDFFNTDIFFIMETETAYYFTTHADSFDENTFEKEWTLLNPKIASKCEFIQDFVYNKDIYFKESEFRYANYPTEEAVLFLMNFCNFADEDINESIYADMYQLIVKNKAVTNGFYLFEKDVKITEKEQLIEYFLTKELQLIEEYF